MDTILRLLTPKKATYFILDTSTIRQALEKFDAHKFSVVPLLNEAGEYVGTLSEGDILRYIKNQAKFDITKAENVEVKDIEHYRPYKCLKIDATLDEIFSLILDQNFVPLIDDNDHYIGIIKRKDVLIHFGEKK